MSLRESKREATAQAIKAAARRLFLAQGFDETTMDQVASAAGVSRASLFNYFPGKPALLDALGSDLESRLVQGVGHYRAKYPLPGEALGHLFSHAGRVLEQTAGITRLLFMHSSGGAGFPRLLAAFAELAGEAQAGGRWRSDLEADQLAEVLYLGFVAGLLDWCGGDAPGDRAPGDRAALLERRARGLNRLLEG